MCVCVCVSEKEVAVDHERGVREMSGGSADGADEMQVNIIKATLNPKP